MKQSTNSIHDVYLGSIQTKITGMQYAEGNINAGNEVHLERDPDNQHDPNAIRVKNMDFDDAGFIPRKIASWLSPLIDKGAIFVEGWIPEQSISQSIHRHRGCPVILKIFLSKKGAYILQPKLTPSTDVEALQETIRSVFERVSEYTKPDVIRGLGKRLESLAKNIISPETHLLLALFPSKAKEIENRLGNTALNSIRDVLKKLRLGDPIHHHNLTLFPIFPNNGISAKYVLLKSALDSGDAVLEEVSEEGEVNELILQNHGFSPVLVPGGEILTGAKQNRIVNISILVATESNIRIPVSCVERGRWEYASHKFEATHYAHPTLRRRTMQSTQACRSESGMARSDQGAVWEAVESHLHDLKSSSPTESVTDGYQQANERIKEYRGKFTLSEETTGVLVCRGKKIIGMDCFDSPAIFQQCWDRLADSYFMEAICDPDQKEETPFHSTDKFIEKVSQEIELADSSIGLGNELIIQSNDMTGSGVWYSDSLCHLSIFSI